MARACLVCVVVLATLVVAGSSASAASTFTVTSTADVNHGACTPTVCSLRDAIGAANLGSGDTVVVPAGDYPLTIGALNPTSSMTISGAGAAVTTIHAAPNVRVLTKGGGNSTISGLTITGGKVAGAEPTGGGIENTTGDLTITASVITGNTATGTSTSAQGAGIYNSGGNLTIENSTIEDNHASSTPAEAEGGGIFDKAAGTTLTITGGRLTGNSAASGGGVFLTVDGVTLKASDSTFQGNQATASFNVGGAIFDNAAQTATITGTTFAGNSSDGGGGAWFGSAPLNVTNSTFQGNTSSGPTGVGGAIFNNGAVHATNVTFDGNTTGSGHQTFQNNSPVAIVNSIISSPGGDNCESAALTSLGHNIESDNSCGLTGPSDTVNTNPGLGGLADNGGPTLTELPAGDSPAVNNGLFSSCPATDQRGVTRPQDGNCDIGAIERTFAADLGVSVRAVQAVVKLNSKITYTVAVTNGGPDTATRVGLGAFFVPNLALGVNGGFCMGAMACTPPSIAPGGAVTTTVDTLAPAGRPGKVTLSVSVAGERPDPDPANNSASATVFVGPASVSRLSISPHKFAAAGRGATFSARRGARVRFTLSRASKVRFVLQRRAAGRRVGSKCRAPSGHNRNRKPCKRFVSVRHGRFERAGKSGANSVRFSARVHGKALKPGHYRLQLIPHDAGGTAKAKSVSFRVVAVKHR